MDNQRGFVTLEIILVVLIIAVLSIIAVPKMARIVDEAQLDYEMKMFLSTVDFAKSLNKNAHYISEIFPTSNLGGEGYPIQIDVVESQRRYEVVRDNKRIFEPHQLPQGFSIECQAGLSPRINLSKNNVGNVMITSRLEDKRYIIVDSVGRWRGDNKPAQ